MKTQCDMGIDLGNGYLFVKWVLISFSEEKKARIYERYFL
jgi:hypothetical protein